MFLVSALLENCQKKIEENIANVLEKLYSTTFDVDGLLKDLLDDNARSAAVNMISTYVEQNMYQLGAAALQSATGINLEAAWNLLQTAVANFLTGFDDAKFHILKNAAKRTLKLLEEKSVLLDKIEHEFTLYYNILVALSSGDPIYDEYLDRLRQGLIELDLAETDFQQVLSELQRGMDKPVTKQIKSPDNAYTYDYLKQESQGTFLRHVYDSGKDHFQLARLLITPEVSRDYISDRIHNRKVKEFFDVGEDPTYAKAGAAVIATTVLPVSGLSPLLSSAALAKEASNPESGLRRYTSDPKSISTGDLSVDGLRGQLPDSIGKATPRTLARKHVDNYAFLARNIGLPAQDEQIANWGMLGEQAKKVASSMGGYIQQIVQINSQLLLFTSGLINLQQTIPTFLKTMSINRLLVIIKHLKMLKEEIAENVNGDKEALDGPISDTFTPIIFVISGQANFWAAKMDIIDAYLRTFPETAIDTFALKNEQKAAFNSAVEQLKELDDIITPTTVLPAEDGREDAGSLEALLAGFIAETHAALYTFSVDEEVLESGRGIIERFTLTRRRDAEIYTILNDFIEFDAAIDEEMEKMAEDLAKFMEDSGMGKMQLDWINGNFIDFFGTSSRGANNLAAALAVVSLLMDCFDGDPAEQDKFAEVAEEIQGLQALLNVKLNLDLDLNILRNINECLKLKGFALDFDFKKFLCGLIGAPTDGTPPKFENLIKEVKIKLGISEPKSVAGDQVGAAGSVINAAGAAAGSLLK